MSTEFLDETFDEQQSREKLEYFFGQYSAEVRRNLLSKNVKKPENIYDVLYTTVRRDMLAKNAVPTFNQDLGDTAIEIRNTMLAKHVEKQINLDVSGENYRQTQISKNNLLKTTIELNNLSNSIRENLLAKNIEKDIDLDRRSAENRNLNLSNNAEKNINLDEISTDLRNNMLSKNDDSNTSSLEFQSISLREHMLSSNVKSEINLDNSASEIRANSLNKNLEHDINLDKDSARFREIQESKNTEKNINLDSVADSIRSNMLSFNSNETSQNIESIANVARQTNESSNDEKNINLDNIADGVRQTMTSGNINTENPLEKIAEGARGNQNSKNDDKNINLDNQSSLVRSNMLSSNKDVEINIDKSSEAIRGNMLSSNKESDVNLERTGESIRNKMLSNNKESNTDLDKTSKAIRENLLSSNKELNINLDKSSEAPRESLLSSNVPNDINLDSASEIPRNTLLASNVANNIDLDNISETPRNTLLASNVANNIDLDNLSETPRNSLLASNVANNIDLDNLSQTPRNNLLASNVPNNIDLDVSSAVPRASLLASNVPNNIDLDQNSINPRNQLLNANVPTIINLDQNSLIPRNNLLAANVPANINLDNNALQVRNTLLSANIQTENQLENIASIFRHDLLSKNHSNQGLGTTIYLAGTSTFIGVSNLEIMSAPIRELMKLKDKVFNRTTDLQAIYGFALSGAGTPIATITNAAQLYNLQKNAFMNVRYEDRNSGYNTLLNHNSQGFQELLSFSQFSNKRELETNTTPANVIAENRGVYVGMPSNLDGTSSVTGLLKPGNENAALGTAASMMSNTVPGDSIAVNFNKHERGVSRIINTIRKDTSIAMAKNYDVQNNNSFIVGTNSDGTNKLAYSRYTVANPYQPNADAGTLELRIKNYAIYNGNKRLVHTMSFPPYIKSFANSDSASWNKVDFLGRPEPIYTFSNASREGSLSFYILTDYSQQVDAGYDYEKSKPFVENFEKHFTSKSDAAEENADIDVEIVDKKSKISELQDQLAVAQENDVADSGNIKSQIDTLISEVSNLESKQLNTTKGKQLGPNRNYKEFDIVNGNIYKTLINNGNPVINGSIDPQTEQTKERLARMKKDLLFQPAFFSGDKVDMVNRMEFMAKLTRPSRSSASKGFSFTFPPVCHIHLGDWFNHDVIINNVSYDYSDAPWTIDGSGGRVQPMWALVSLSFNIVGTYGGYPNEDVPLSTDTGGFYQRKQNRK